MSRGSIKGKQAELAATGYAVVCAVLAVVVSFPTIGELIFRGFLVQDADEVIRSWYGRCAFENANIIPYSHLSMPGWTAVLAVCEQVGRLFGLPLTLGGRLVTVFASWACLINAARWIRRMGGSDRLALIGVALIAASPGYFLLSLSVYPSVALAALAVTSCRLWSEERHRAAVITIGLAPLVRWEGLLLVLLFAAFTLRERQWRNLPFLLAPYAVYLLSNALRFGNPWKPLAYRTTKHFGAWLIFNPSVGWDLWKPALLNLTMLFTPLVLVGGLGVAAYGGARHFKRLGPAPWAFAGLAISLLSIQHDYKVWALRVFATPYVLGVLTVVGVAALATPRWRAALLWTTTLATVVTLGLGVYRINQKKVKPPGGFDGSEVGFHMSVRYADATPTLDQLRAAKVDWILVNHLNANLLRADSECSLWSMPLWLGKPRMSLGRDFVPTFGLPSGEGLLVFHALPLEIPGCRKLPVRSPGQTVLHCGGNSAVLPPVEGP